MSLIIFYQEEKVMPNWKLVWWKTTEQLSLHLLHNVSSVQQLMNGKLGKGFPVLHVAFSPTHSGADDFPLEYRMFSQDFLTDLLGPLEITATLSLEDCLLLCM